MSARVAGHPIRHDALGMAHPFRWFRAPSYVSPPASSPIPFPFNYFQKSQLFLDKYSAELVT